MMMMSNNEEWKDIPGYEGFYQVSNRGRVRSVTHTILMSNGALRTIFSRILVLHEGGRNKYLQAYLHKDGHVKNHLVHRLVAKMFIGEIKSGYEINHKNANVQDNNVENLEIVTHQENINHSIKNNLFKAYGENHYAAKLSKAIADEIRSKYAKGNIMQRELARLYGVKVNVIFKIVHNLTYMR
jgi:hypothetical protein